MSYSCLANISCLSICSSCLDFCILNCANFVWYKSSPCATSMLHDSVVVVWLILFFFFFFLVNVFHYSDVVGQTADCLVSENNCDMYWHEQLYMLLLDMKTFDQSVAMVCWLIVLKYFISLFRWFVSYLVYCPSFIKFIKDRDSSLQGVANYFKSAKSISMVGRSGTHHPHNRTCNPVCEWTYGETASLPLSLPSEWNVQVW